MPELPDITVYVESLRERVRGQVLRNVRIGSPFVLRTAVPPISQAQGRLVEDVFRMDKRPVLQLEGELYLVMHLMIAGRLHWRKAGTALAKKAGLAAFDFDNGSIIWTEAGTKRRASLHVVQGAEALGAMRRAGVDVTKASFEQFCDALQSRPHTLKRALTDPDVVSGIGNAYSDEILHRARLSPVKRTGTMTSSERQVLYEASRAVLAEWVERLRALAKGDFPEHVTAFREGMAVHGRYGQPCPVCGMPVQRIVYAENESNYCAGCQTGGKLLADRSLSRLLRGDWPRTVQELEERRRPER